MTIGRFPVNGIVMNKIMLMSLLLILQLLWATHLFAEDKRFVAQVVDGKQTVEIIGGDYFFDPNVVVLQVNVPVEFKAKKEKGVVPHDLVILAPEAGIDVNIGLKSDWQTVTFVPTRVGTYPMECQKKLLWFESHKEKGMEGRIEVIQ